MIILGIDPGSRITGFGLINSRGNHSAMIEAGPIRLQKIEDIGERLVVLADTLEELITRHKPDAMALEKVFHGVNAKSTLVLGYARGVILLCAARHNLPVAEYAATEVKKAITGFGRAEKTQIKEMVKILLKLEKDPKPHDVTDALAIALCHAHMGPIKARIKEQEAKFWSRVKG
ncbi:crossover junction endodeoxyribonuclease RuvC [Acanthopleuribacter pedis]|uniref:Crossover junction endodeoxyribonuclease RuvC n=1 Tax=Acanthopleuribacter pedis TaxID=442870 RepID=A0A8J7QDD9_9BACT|nr:crossover junction endodeoxyribonuclease RuvC [Acanthopleuribacter pedis]MBO1317540.1 crossover junction endodeoxyribonuclease RuvC [Acanthopleuribacter pedis]